MPQNICVDCITELIKVHNFIEKCKNTDNVLKEIIEKNEAALALKHDDNYEEVEEYVYVHVEDEVKPDTENVLISTVDEQFEDMKTEEDDSNVEMKGKKMNKSKRPKYCREALKKTFICNSCGMGNCAQYHF